MTTSKTETPAENWSSRTATPSDAIPRHAKERNPIWTYIALGGYFAIAGFIGAFLGTLAANIL